MKAVVFEILFSPGNRKNKEVILRKIWPPYFCDFLERKEFESDPFIGSKSGFKRKLTPI
jgi:hypothetical protein